MDPNATLRVMLDRARVILEMADAGAELPDEATELAEAVEAINDWLSREGFLPQAWERYSRRGTR